VAGGSPLGVYLTCGVRQDSVQLGRRWWKSINTLLAMLVKRIESRSYTKTPSLSSIS